MSSIRQQKNEQNRIWLKDGGASDGSASPSPFNCTAPHDECLDCNNSAVGLRLWGPGAAEGYRPFMGTDPSCSTPTSLSPDKARANRFKIRLGSFNLDWGTGAAAALTQHQDWALGTRWGHQGPTSLHNCPPGSEETVEVARGVLNPD